SGFLAHAQTTVQLMDRPSSSFVNIYNMVSAVGTKSDTANVLQDCAANVSPLSCSAGSGDRNCCTVGTSQDNCLMTCPSGSAVCGEEFLNGNWVSRLLCCKISQQALQGGVAIAAPYYSADSDVNNSTVDCVQTPDASQCHSNIVLRRLGI